MNKLLSKVRAVGPIHRIGSKTRSSTGIRWSSYVGQDFICSSGSKSLMSFATAFQSSSTTFIHNNITATGTANNQQRKLNNGTTTTRRSLSTTTSKSPKSSSSSPRQQGTSTTLNPKHERLLILGSGVAGCATELTAARYGIP